MRRRTDGGSIGRSAEDAGSTVRATRESLDRIEQARRLRQVAHGAAGA